MIQFRSRKPGSPSRKNRRVNTKPDKTKKNATAAEPFKKQYKREPFRALSAGKSVKTPERAGKKPSIVCQSTTDVAAKPRKVSRGCSRSDVLLLIGYPPSSDLARVAHEPEAAQRCDVRCGQFDGWSSVEPTLSGEKSTAWRSVNCHNGEAAQDSLRMTSAHSVRAALGYREQMLGSRHSHPGRGSFRRRASPCRVSSY